MRIEEQIRKHLEDNKLFADEIRLYDDAVEVDISWGDWKHEHLRCNFLMSELGCENWGEATTEEDGSDCYSATHVYKLPSKWRVQ